MQVGKLGVPLTLQRGYSAATAYTLAPVTVVSEYLYSALKETYIAGQRKIGTYFLHLVFLSLFS